MVKLLRIRHMACRTEETYIGWIRRLDRFHVDKRLDQIGEDELKGFLNHLAVEEGGQCCHTAASVECVPIFSA